MMYLLLDELKLVGKSIKDYKRKILSEQKNKDKSFQKKIERYQRKF